MEQLRLISGDESLPGEDRSFGGHLLYVDLVPATAWSTNVRSQVSSQDWRRLASFVRKRSENRCEICGDCPSRSCDVHERWSYGTHGGVAFQRLERLVCLCSSCHEATHMGFAELRGNGERARSHLGRVNRWSSEQVVAHVLASADLFRERSLHLWELDLSIIERAGYVVAPPPVSEVREAIALDYVKER